MRHTFPIENGVRFVLENVMQPKTLVEVSLRRYSTVALRPEGLPTLAWDAQSKGEAKRFSPAGVAENYPGCHPARLEVCADHKLDHPHDHQD